MRHSRPDYNRIQDPAADSELIGAYDNAMNLVARGNTDPMTLQRALSKLCRRLTPTIGMVVGENYGHIRSPIADTEPVFLLRAQDVHAPDTLRDYAQRLYDRGKGNADAAHEIRMHAEAMEAWQREHGSKTPDAPRSTP